MSTQTKHPPASDSDGRWLARLVGPLDDGTQAVARISFEHGWLCIRNDHGWLLFKAKCADMPRDGFLLSAVLEEASAHHEEWCEEKRRNDPDWPNIKGEPRSGK